jgi:hypothetical protein
MTGRPPQPLSFMRGARLYQIARARDGAGYVGFRDGRIVASGAERADVARVLIDGATSRPVSHFPAIAGTSPTAA